MSQERRIEQMKQIQQTALELFVKKNTDYGDAFAEFGTIGVLMRIEDEIKRSLSFSLRKPDGFLRRFAYRILELFAPLTLR
jgi:hypothetical protein